MARSNRSRKIRGGDLYNPMTWNFTGTSNNKPTDDQLKTTIDSEPVKDETWVDRTFGFLYKTKAPEAQKAQEASEEPEEQKASQNKFGGKSRKSKKYKGGKSKKARK